MKKLLPLAEPISFHSPSITYLLSIIELNENFRNWLVDNLLNIYVPKDYTLRLDGFFRTNEFYNCPFLTCSALSYGILDNMNLKFSKIIEFLIQNNCYIYGLINREPIRLFNRSKTAHNMLIYGYNSFKKRISFCDFVPLQGGENGEYKKLQCSFREMNKAIKNFNGDNYVREEDVLYLLHMKQNVRYKYNISDLKRSIKYFLNSTNLIECNIGSIYLQYYSVFSNEKEDYCFGAACYDLLADQIQKKDFLMVRPLVLIKDYAVLWQRRLNILKEENIIRGNSELLDELINEVIDLSKRVIIFFLKMGYVHSSQIKNRKIMKADILKLKKKQVDFLKNVLKLID
ncbi:hypothetical protein NIE88_17340 [Sporolactobacillus shoreicorticis]|uniref:Butirosin biosynthesis protein H N-terminal domain-containing protein n=1 Tax=Sporolactobacillus shoreicorticis TaxID=1923877 RepID=A0ABW5RZY8_9BACL|nr:hypothetical protein [Sporolactobacillus shoreicorticis]MCO7127524.1 hypothetical protein [Sporolactobacillus shoreicorticis]